jgi:hypothetical protein
MRTLFPPGRICQIPLVDIRALLLQMFRRWGMPSAIRTDNGEPFGVPTRDVVPILSLWLIAFGIRPILNRPRRPQDNAKVERNQGTASRWAEVYGCPNLKTLQTQLDEACDFQRNRYPVKKLKGTRSAVFDTLNNIQRPFDESLFDEQKAYRHLEKTGYPRKVSSNGGVCIYNQVFQVGLKHKGKIVILKFQAQPLAWLAYEFPGGDWIKTIPDPRFSRENLFNLTICQ